MTYISKWSGRSKPKGSGLVTVTNMKGEFLRVEHSGGWKISDERLMYRTLNAMWPGEYHIDHYRPDWLKNPKTGHNLELDRFYPWMKLAFEYNGRHHSGKYQMYKDEVKAERCKERGIALVIIKSAKVLNAKTIVEAVEQSRAALSS